MEERASRAHAIPVLYLAILDLVAQLERAPGGRDHAARFRRDAIALYGKAWDEQHEQRLVRLRASVARALDRCPPRDGKFGSTHVN